MKPMSYKLAEAQWRPSIMVQKEVGHGAISTIRYAAKGETYSTREKADQVAMRIGVVFVDAGIDLPGQNA